MKSPQTSGAATKTAKTSTSNLPQYKPGSADVPDMEVITGYYGDAWCKAVGFHKGRLSLFEYRLGRQELIPLTLRQAAHECEKLTALGDAAALDFISLNECAQAKFYRMIAAALR